MPDTNPNKFPLTLPRREPTLRVVAMPSDLNYAGDVFGGWIMGQVDVAGSIPALHRARGRVVTVAVNSFVFKEPIFMGDVVSFYAEIVKVGNTSMTVSVDVAGSIPALHRARGRVVTVAVNSFVFKEPIFMGDVVSFYAEIVKVGNTSMTVSVDVYAQRDPAKPVCVKVTEAWLTYVAIDENRRPRPVPPAE